VSLLLVNVVTGMDVMCINLCQNEEAPRMNIWINNNTFVI